MAKKKTNTKSKTKSDLSSAQKISFGVGLTATAVAAAGTYFLYGSKDAKKNRNKVKSWMLKAKADVLETLEDAKEMTQEDYEALINNVAATYSGLKSATKVDIKDFKSEMLDHWHAIEDKAKPIKKKVTKTVTKATKKAPAKKAIKKTAKKTTKKKTTKKAPAKKKTTKK